ncbi:MAG: chemotaxis protein CheR [Deltaproteobacteria bacterium]|nr:chemotaxis protein CheR [Deltaproteobacteria bacterium]
MAFTFFFRDMQTLEFIVESVLPYLKTRRYIRVWDAGCAMGPEPYSLAIMIRENMGGFLFRNVKIDATDIDESNQFAEIVKKGIYQEEILKRIPKDIFKRYFSPLNDSGQFQVKEEIRKAVCFQRHDLLSLKPVRDGFGLVLCKNVLLHFKPEERITVIRMFHNALADDGFFVTEQTQKLPAEVSYLFERVTSNGQVFRKVPV